MLDSGFVDRSVGLSSGSVRFQVNKNMSRRVNENY